jgi:hypothetical protein
MAIMSEKETRAQLFDHARHYGVEDEVKKVLARYEDYLKGCKTQAERDACAKMGILEIDHIFSLGKANSSLQIGNEWAKVAKE